jgi:hypothetical protein
LHGKRPLVDHKPNHQSLLYIDEMPDNNPHVAVRHFSLLGQTPLNVALAAGQ